MKKDTIAIIISIVVGIGTIGGVIAANITANKAAKFNKPFKIHEFKTKSFEVEAEALDKLGRSEEAKKVREKLVKYQRAVRAGQFINDSSIQIVYSNPEGVPENQQEKLDNAIKAVENSPLPTGTNTLSLGATYLGVEDYEKALESFDIVLSGDPDDTDAKIFKADALVSIVGTSLDFEITGAPPELGSSAIALIIEAGELITFDDLELSNMQDIYTTKIKTDIDTLGLKIDEWAFGPAGD